jgi:hypothetical protein
LIGAVPLQEFLTVDGDPVTVDGDPVWINVYF